MICARRFSRVFVVCGILVLGLVLPVPVAAVDERDAAALIGDAETALSSGYLAVLEAENSGVNVSILLACLNISGQFLSRAKMWYRKGDFVVAAYYAGLSVDAVADVVETAEECAALALAERRELVIQTALASFIAVIVIALVTVVSWMFFKQRYVRKVLAMTPEVADQ